MIKAVIDTNVLVSAALKYKSIPGSIVRLAFDGLIMPVLNSDIEKEFEFMERVNNIKECERGEYFYLDRKSVV